MAEEDFDEQELKTRKFLSEQIRTAIELRSKDREFHGLNREFLYQQGLLIADYERSRDIKHPRDLGNVREQILRRFLSSSGYLPGRYAVSTTSVRVASPTGHISNEIDIAFYSAADSVTLMKREDVYEVYPIENIYGVIQVKSNLTKKELASAFANISSFKKLEKYNHPRTVAALANPSHSAKGFGIIFAFDSTMKWIDIVKTIESLSAKYPSTEWPNAIVILTRGSFSFGTKERGGYQNEFIESIDHLQMHGHPDREGRCLYDFHVMLLNLLKLTAAGPAKLYDYYELPLVSGVQSYSFKLGAFAEVGSCETHGQFTRKISPEKLAEIVKWCRTQSPINPVAAINKAYGRDDAAISNIDQYAGVWLYNPEGLPLDKILIMPEGIKQFRGLAFDAILTDGREIYVPYYYSIKEQLVDLCPKCNPGPKRSYRRRAKPVASARIES